MDAPLHYRFGPFEVIPGDRRLLRDAQPIAATPKVFETLLVLLRAEGRVVLKEDLMAAVWPDTFVDENSLNRNISVLRKLLGDGERFIETVPKVGYRLIVAPSAPDVRPTAAPPKKRSRILIYAAAGATAVAIAVAITLPRRSPAAGEAIDSIAVLPFVNGGGDSKGDVLSDGMTDSIISSLAQLPRLKVMSRSTMFRYKGKGADPQRVGRELQVVAVLEGRVKQLGDQLDIQTELVKVSDGSRLWGERYHRKIADIFALQDDIAREIARRLRLRLSGPEQRALSKRYTDDSEAYQLYLQGRFYWNKRTETSLLTALGFFHQAIDRDPNYALAYTGVADCYAVISQYGTTPSVESSTKAKAAAMKALEIDPTLAEAHAALGLAHTGLWEWPEAESEFKRAIELKPNYPTAHHWYSLYLRYQGRNEEALREARKAEEFDPLSMVINTNVALVLRLLNRREEAIDHFQKTIALDPKFGLAHMLLGKTYLEVGNPEKGIPELEKAVLLTERSADSLSNLGCGYARVGRRDEAMKYLHELEGLAAHNMAPPIRVALIYVGLGEKDAAFQWMEKDFAIHDEFLVEITVDSAFDSIRSDPRFKDLLRRMHLPASV